MVYIIGIVIFGLLVSGERQPWAMEDGQNKNKEVDKNDKNQEGEKSEGTGDKKEEDDKSGGPKEKDTEKKPEES